MLDRSGAYAEAVKKEFVLRKDTYSEYFKQQQDVIKTIYFGGGTPSVIKKEDLLGILDLLISEYKVDWSIEEITIEMNPSDVNIELLEAYKQGGINRLSIGIQTFHDDKLRFIGRRHNAQSAINAIDIAKQVGFENISIDLMYGLPEETLDDWIEDVEKAIDCGVEHISAYCLSYEKGTPLFNALHNHEILETDENILIEMYDYAVERLEKAGIYLYEISNYAKKGYESKHNSGYWSGAAYIGLGAAAHSYNGKYTREWNVSDINKYISDVTLAYKKGSAQYLPHEREWLSPSELYNETVMLRLRTTEGLKTEDISEKYLLHFERNAVKWLGKYMQYSDSRYSLTTDGRHISNRIIEDLMI